MLKARKLTATLCALFLTFSILDSANAAPTFTASGSSPVYVYANFRTVGSDTWTIPYGVSSVDVNVVGGGGGGGGDGGSAGGGGELREQLGLSVTAGAAVSVSVGDGGAGGSWLTGTTTGSNGSDTTLSIGATSYTAKGGVGGGGWGTTTGGVGGGSGGSGGTGSGGNGYAGKTGGGGAGSCPGATVANGTAGTNGTTSNVNGAVYGSSGGGGVSTDLANSGTATLGQVGGTNAGRGANYKYALDDSTSISGASAGHPGVANYGGGGGGGSACNAYGPMSSANDGYYQRTAGGKGGSGTVVLKFALTAPSTPNLAPASDSGISNSDDITNISVMTFTGTAVGGSSITIYSDGSATNGTCTANASTGAWSCVVSALTFGYHAITAVATMDGGTTTVVSPALNINYDTSPPVLSSSVTNVGGTQITLTFDETLTTATIPNESFTVSVYGVVDNVTLASSSAFTVVLTLSSPIPKSATVTLSYTKPASYQLNTIQNYAGDEIASIASRSITNNANTTASTSISFSVTGATTKFATATLTATITSSIAPAGSVTFYDNGKSITRCSNKSVSGSTATCSWLMMVQGQRAITAKFTPTYPNSFVGSNTTKYIVVGKRTGAR